MNNQGVLITDHRVQRKESPEQCLGGVCAMQKGVCSFGKSAGEYKHEAIREEEEISDGKASCFRLTVVQILKGFDI